MQTHPTFFLNQTAESVARNLVRHALFLILFCPILFGRPASAQSTQEFVGNITDASHAVIAGAVVTVHNEGTGEDVVVKTTRAGDYTAPYLKPGVYSVTADKPGFKSLSFTHITLDIDKTSKLDFILPVGNVSETVTVSDAGAQIELSKADRGEIIGAERVQEMPTDGRNILELFELSPGTVNTHNPQFTRPQDNVGNDLHANGLDGVPVQENLDGAMNDNPGGFQVGFTPPLDSVAEFKVVLNPYDASYGRAGGGAVDVSLKSGTNNIHGDMYEYARRPWLDANNFSNDYNYSQNGLVVKPAHKRDQFGLEADGPVRIPRLYDGRDKTFFTVQWEQAYENLPNTSPNISSIPNPQWLTGNFAGAQYYNTTTKSLQPLIIYDPLSPVNPVTHAHSPFPGNIIPATCTPVPPATACSHLDPLGLALAQYYAGITPNNNPGPGVSPYTNNFYNLGVENDLSRTGLIKLEHTFGPNDRGTIRWGGFERYATENANGIPLVDPANQAFHQIQPKDQTFALDEVHTFSPNFILDNKATLLNAKLGLLNGVFGNFLGPLGFSPHFINNAFIANMFPQVTGTGYIDLGVGGPGNYTITHNLAYQPSVTLVRGRHTFRAGYDMRLSQIASPGGGNNNSFSFSRQFTQEYYSPGASNGGDPTGATSGNGIASLLIGDPSAGSLKYSISPFYSQHYYSGWAQDDWKVNSKLTLNFGLRYDLLQAPVERHNKLNYAFDTTNTNTLINNAVQAQHPNQIGTITGGIRFAGVNGAPRGAYTANLLHFQPRFGAAYAFSNKTSLRAGFGEMFINNTSNDSSNGYSADSTYNPSLDNGLTPFGHLSDPFPATPGNPSGTAQPSGSSLGLATTPGSTVNFTNPHYQVPSIWEYSVSLEQLLSSRDVLDISYSGSQLYNGEGNININPISAAYTAPCDFDRTGDPLSHNLCDGTGPGQGFVANPFQNVSYFSGTSYYSNLTISRGALSRPFPAFTDITQSQSNIIHTWYNSLQVAASHTMSRSLTVHAAYTWSKSMRSGDQIDATNGIYSRQLDPNDRPNILTFSSVFYVPVGRDKAFLGHTNRLVDTAIGGWEISPLYVYTEGTPWFPQTSSGGIAYNWVQMQPVGIKAHDLPADGAHTFKRLQGVNQCVAYESVVNVKNAAGQNIPTVTLVDGPTYIEAGCTRPAMVRAAPTYSVAHNVVFWGLRNGSVHEFDASISKNFLWTERVHLQARLDIFNVLNHPNWNNTYNSDPTSINFGSITKGPTGPGTPPRDMQLSGKLVW